MALSIEAFVGMLEAQGVSASTGVPCSYLDALVSFCASSERLPYTIAASEGEAIAIAAGSWLAGRFPVVLMQNSGLGNAINPLTSLACTNDIPMLLLVSHRSRDGQDAPQHRLMGSITYGLLDCLGLVSDTLPDEAGAAREVLERAVRTARQSMRPVALVVPKGSFEPFSDDRPLPAKRPRLRVPEGRRADDPLVPRVAALSVLAEALRDDDLVVSTTGMTSRELFHVRDRPATFYMPGSMGCAPGIALGVARAAPTRRIVVLDGDGALLMKAGTLATIGHYRPRGLLHLLLDNGGYESTGGQPSVSSSVSFEGLAAAAGYARSVALPDLDALDQLVQGFELDDGPLFASLRIAGGHLAGVGRVGRSPQQVRDAFREAASGRLRVP